MNILKNMSVGKKMNMPYVFVVAFLIALCFNIYSKSGDVSKQVDQLANHAIPSLTLIDNVYMDMTAVQKTQFSVFSEQDKSQIDDIIKTADDKITSADQDIVSYTALLDTDKEKALMATVQSQWDNYKKQSVDFDKAVLSNNLVAAHDILDGQNATFAKIDDLTNQLYDINTNSIAKNVVAVRASVSNLLYSSIIVAIVIMFVSAIMNAMLSRQISNSLSRISALAEAIAAGDLAFRFNRSELPNDELGALADSSMRMQHNLRELIKNIGTTVAQLNTSVEEVSAVAEQSSSGMQSQQSEITLVAAAMEEMHAAVAEVASSTEDSSVASIEANREANEGTEEVRSTIAHIEKASVGMQHAGELVEQLEKDSININVVVDVIRGIAEQTNLLALNAAIEAARAGDHGRGFSVVADEVRTLAGRTQESTGEIVNLIEKLQASANAARETTSESCDLIARCVEQSTQTGNKISSIETKVNSISRMSEQIATACSQQDSVTAELGVNIERINESSSETAKGAEYTAKACTELSRLAVDLQNELEKFKVN